MTSARLAAPAYDGIRDTTWTNSRPTKDQSTRSDTAQAPLQLSGRSRLDLVHTHGADTWMMDISVCSTNSTHQRDGDAAHSPTPRGEKTPSQPYKLHLVQVAALVRQAWSGQNGYAATDHKPCMSAWLFSVSGELQCHTSAVFARGTGQRCLLYFRPQVGPHATGRCQISREKHVDDQQRLACLSILEGFTARYVQSSAQGP